MKKAKIIVLSGQSNAVGVGYTKYLKKSFSDEKIKEYLRGFENIKISYYSHDKKSDGFTVTTTGCTEANKDTVGPELGIAEYLNKKFPGEEYFIVKFAMGGASLKHDFLPPSSGGYYNFKEFKKEHSDFIDACYAGNPLNAGWCYNCLVGLVDDSINYLKESGYAPEIIGFCWMQGESDANILDDVNGYKVYFDNLIKDFRNEFGEYTKACTFVDAGISDIWPFHKEMNEFKKEYAKSHDNFVYVDTIGSGLTTRYEPTDEPDIAHYDCASVIKLGKLFAENI